MPQAVAPKSSEALIAVALIRTDGGTQPRAALNDNLIDEYAAEMAAGAKFPPVIVYYDGEFYWLADGFHRTAAAKKIESKAIAAEVRQGTRREAVLFSVGANAQHGLRRSNADKRRAVVTLLSDPEWSVWNNVKIGKQCGVTEKLVRTIKEELTSSKTKIDAESAKEYGVNETTLKSAQRIVESQSQSAHRLVQRGGTTYPLKTTRIGKSKQSSSTPASQTQTPTSKPKPEIVAIRRRQKSEGEQKIEGSTPEMATVVLEKTQDESGRWWQLGKHRLYCGNPNSPKFQEQLPEQIALMLFFPATREDWPNSVSLRAEAFSALYTPQPARDLEFLRDIVAGELNRHTDEDDFVIIAFLPDPELLLLVDEFGCRCLVAEPDAGRCEAAIASWKRTGAEAQPIKKLKF